MHWTHRAAPSGAVLLLVTLVAWVLWRLDPFGPPFASMDHPFHISRAETLRRSLLDGEILRWVAHHQGGYPVEFYPFGVAYLVVALSAVTVGAIPIATAHKLVAIAIFLAPAGAYAWYARRDGWPMTIGLTASVFHLLIPAGAYHGGFRELITWGMVPNVAAATAALFFTVAALNWLTRGDGRSALIAAVLAASAAWMNPRSLVAVASATAAAILVSLARGASWRDVAARSGLLAAMAALLAAPEWVSLARFGGMYHFIHFTRYEGVGQFLRASIESVTAPVLVLACIGLLTAARRPGRPATQAAAVAAVVHVVATLIAMSTALVPQLEPTRLMPFQRFLTIYLAAVGLHAVVDAAGRFRSPGRRRGAARPAIELAAAALLVALATVPASSPDRWPATVAADTTARAEMPDFTRAIGEADEAAPHGTAVLVMGSEVSIHQQLWSPAIRDRWYFYDDWLWDWHIRHAGPHDRRALHAYPVSTWSRVLTSGHLQAHAVGAVVAGGAARALAGRSPALELMHAGTWFDVFRVRSPVHVVSWPGGTPTLDASNHRLSATGTSSGGRAVIRRTWHSRWRAEVNGRAQPIRQREDGYMEVEVPAGRTEMMLVYALDRWDWLGRASAAAALIALPLFWIRSRRPHEQPAATAAVAGQR